MPKRDVQNKNAPKTAISKTIVTFCGKNLWIQDTEAEIYESIAKPEIVKTY